MKKQLYNLLYDWLVCECDCDYCQHIQTFRDEDKRHPCNQCTNYDKFKVSDNIAHDLKEKAKMIVEIIKKNDYDNRNKVQHRR